METSEIIALVTGIIALVVAGLAYWRSGQPLTLQGVQEIATDTAALAADLTEVAQVAVAASQQLKESGKIASNEAAFQNAVNHVESWYNTFAPDIELDPKVVANAVEGAYFWLKRAQGANPPATDGLDILDRWEREQASRTDLPTGPNAPL